MRNIASVWVAMILAGSIAACSDTPQESLQIPTGSDVTLEKRDGVKISGRLVEVQAQEVVVEARDGRRTRVPRSEIASLTAASGSVTAGEPASAPAPLPAPGEATTAASSRPGTRSTGSPADGSTADKTADRLPEYREVTIPAGTTLPIQLRTTVGSHTSQVEDQVRGTLRRAITVNDVEAIPAGATVLGTVTEATRSGRVKGVARVAFRFSSIDPPGDPERVPIRTNVIAREAQPTKKRDAAKIGGGAAAGAVIGGLIGGGDGAAKGAAIGGAAGTGVVLSTRGKEVTLPAGTNVSTKLSEAVTVRVRVRG